MRTPQQALDEIAYLLYVQAPIKELDRWLKRAVEAGHVENLVLNTFLSPYAKVEGDSE
tara:strand:+ start:341 stop:514 length:174 start_codon:yes stop_codon:yes gene_type:complete